MRNFVLVYASVQTCSGCVDFESDWKQIKSQLSSEARCVHHNLSLFDQRVSVLTSPGYWYPMVLLFRKSDYQKYFNHEGNLRSEVPSGKLVGCRFGAIEENGKFINTGRFPTYTTVIDWYNRSKDKLS